MGLYNRTRKPLQLFDAMNRETVFLEKLAKAYQTYDAFIIEDDMADDVHYVSLWVFQEITSKEEYMDYLKGKFQTMKNTGATQEFQIVDGLRHPKALLITKVNGCDDKDAGFVVDFNDEGKVEMINLTIPAFF